MIIFNKYIPYIILLFLVTLSVNAQNSKLDSLSKQSFEDLKNYFDKVQIDSINDIIYGKALLLKARRHLDTIKIADAYFYLSEASTSLKALKYCDSIIWLTKNIKDSITYPSLGYLQKGNINYRLGKYQKSLDDYMMCYNVSVANKNQFYQMAAKQSIGLLKNKMGEREDALEIFKSYIDFIEKNDIGDKDFYLSNGYYLLADSYVYNKKQDSASLFINKGKEIAIKINDSLMYAHYIYLSGVNYFIKKRYKKSIDSLLRSKKIYYEENLNSTTNLYLGKSYYELNDKKQAFKYFKEVDSFLQKTKNVTPELLEIYKPLIKNEKNKNDLEQQLYYINSFLRFDSILDINNTYLSNKIIKKIEIPSLLTTRDNIIEELKVNNKIFEKYISWLIIVLVLLFIYVLYLINKNISNKKKFKTLMEQEGPKKGITLHKETSSLLSEELANKILLKLENFEKKQKFTKKQYSLNDLAKELNTNSSYLSKIINSSKQVNFTNYLNQLRIEYAIEKLKTDSLFRNYTIQAIAEESGFNKAQSFSTAFKKETGISVTYFINQLK